MGPSGRIGYILHILDCLGQDMQVLYLGRAPRTKETLPDFLKWRRVTRPPLVFRGLTGSQQTPGFWGVTPSVHFCTWTGVVVVNCWDRFCTLGRAPRTKEILPDFREWCWITQHSRVFHGLTGYQRDTPGMGRHRPRATLVH